MTAREDLLAAARSLTARGVVPFSPADLISEARRQGSRYPDSTLRTHIVGPMCANSPDHHGVQWGDLVRLHRGQYRLADRLEERPAQTSRTVVPPHESRVPFPTAAVGPSDEWSWEGKVQALVVSHLVAQGWQIHRVANTAGREGGVDIEAVRDEDTLLVEIKGYPSTRYVRGNQRGELKPTRPAAQARHWYSQAVLSGLLLRGDRPEARVVLAFPDFETYRSLAERTAAPLKAAGLEVWLVEESGVVRRTQP